MNDYAIVSIGLIDSLGSNVEECWNSYIEGKTAFNNITNFNVDDYPVIKIKEAYEINDSTLQLENFLDRLEIRQLDRYAKIGLYAVDQAINKCVFKNKEKTAVVFSSLGGSMISMLNSTMNLLSNKKSSPRQCLSSQRDSLTGIISRKYGFKGVTLSLTSACSSGIISLDYATKLLDDDYYDQVIVGGCDIMVDPMDLYMFQSIGALSDNGISKPFDVSRNGFVMGEGASAYIIKKLSTAIAHGDTILGIIKGIGYANETYHETSMDPTGSGGREAIDMALKRANISNTEVGLVNAHATSTPNGDLTEYDILSDYFPNVPVQALKANIGHTMAACSLVEMSYMIQSMNNNLIGPVANVSEPIGDNILLSKNKMSINVKYGIKNSFGFGGKSACIIIEKFL